MKMLKLICVKIRKDRIRNEYIHYVQCSSAIVPMRRNFFLCKLMAKQERRPKEHYGK